MTWWRCKYDAEDPPKTTSPYATPPPDRRLVHSYSLASDGTEMYMINRKEEYGWGFGDHLTLSRSEAQDVIMELTRMILEIDRMKACKEAT